MARCFNGAAARRTREEQGTRIEAVAAAIGRTTRALSDYELGHSQPPVGIAADIAAVLGIPLDVLVTAC